MCKDATTTHKLVSPLSAILLLQRHFDVQPSRRRSTHTRTFIPSCVGQRLVLKINVTRGQGKRFVFILSLPSLSFLLWEIAATTVTMHCSFAACSYREKAQTVQLEKSSENNTEFQTQGFKSSVRCRFVP